MNQQTLTAINIYLGGLFRKTLIGCEPNSGRDSIIPNYAADLNACHEFMEMLTDDQIAIFTRHLQAITKPQLGTPHFKKKWWSNFMRATARQRCEAYLRTIGKWKEEFNS